MLKIDLKLSLILSYIFCFLGFIGSFLGAFLIIFDMRLVRIPEGMEPSPLIVSLVCIALLFLLVILANVLLVRLLNRVRHDEIFTEKSVSLLRSISWLSILAGLICIPLCFFWMVLPFIGLFVGLFLGLVLRVVKIVIQKATLLKEENDAVI